MEEGNPFQRSNSETPSMGITMAPLVDVVFLLLIFFMVTTTFQVRPGLRIELPRAGGERSTPEDRWIISISEESDLYLNKEKVDSQTLETRLKSDRKPVILRADKSVPHGIIVSVLDRVRSAGVETVDVSTRPLNDQQ